MNSTPSPLKLFFAGSHSLLPLATGVIPFGLIMGTVSAEAQLSFIESIGLNFIVFAGASQLVAVELMSQGTHPIMVVLTCLVVNMRMLMYSTSLAPTMKDLNPLKKLGLAYLITDQAYAVSILEFDHLKSISDKVIFYLGASLTMFIVWQISVVVGLFFGDIAPKSLSLEFAVPLAFMSIAIPAIKNKTYALVALSSALFSILFYYLPFHLGLLASALAAMMVGYFIDKPLEGSHG